MRATTTVGIAGALLLVAAVLWNPVVAPRLAKLPVDFKTTVDMTGTFEVRAAPGTLAALPSPLRLPVQVDLAVVAIGTDPGGLVLSEKEVQKVGQPSGPTEDLTLDSDFVLDRQTTMNVKSAKAWSMTPDNGVDRAGSYSFAFGFDFDPNATFPLWDDSIAASYPLRKDPAATASSVQGLAVTTITGSAVAQPADPHWISALAPLSLPASLTPDQWKAAGIPVTSTAAPVDVQYLVTLQTTVLIDNETGGTAELTNEQITLLARPDPRATGGTPANPVTVFVDTLAETQPSVATDTAILSGEGAQLRLLKRWVPLALACLGGLCAVVAAVLFVRRTRRDRSNNDGTPKGDAIPGPGRA